MSRYAIASATLMATMAAARQLGDARIVNSCNYDVHFSVVAAGGSGIGVETSMLAAGEDWTQQWTQLSNNAGWSMKLSKDDNFQHDILQYEYAYQGDDNLWYDLSAVDGNPWDNDWLISAEGGNCSPRQAAYRHATDDAHGMQHCAPESTITVTICSSGQEQTDDSPSEEAPATTPEANVAAAAEAPQPTTFATRVSKASDANVPVNIVTEYETTYVTATPPAQKRHEHHHGHGGA